ncbi:MAG: type I methionyl aminopeptidase [Patescibacteria group bacterium]
MIIRADFEREALRKGGARLATLLQKLATMVAPEVSVMSLEAEAQKLIKETGDTPAFLGYQPHGAKRPYPAALCVSINDAIVHGIPEEGTVIQDGDVVTLDCGLVHEDFITDSAVTVYAGTVSEEKKLLIRATEEALAAGINAARTGNHMGDIGYAIERVGKKYSLGSPRELGGHSVGNAVHEEPFVPNFGTPGKGPILEEGMVIAIEPMFMLGSSGIRLDADGYTYRTRDGSCSAHSEHTVIVGAQGAEVLTKRP